MRKALSGRVECMSSILWPSYWKENTNFQKFCHTCAMMRLPLPKHTPTINKKRNKEVNVKTKKTFVRNNVVLESVLFKMCFFFYKVEIGILLWQLQCPYSRSYLQMDFVLNSWRTLCSALILCIYIYYIYTFIFIHIIFIHIYILQNFLIIPKEIPKEIINIALSLLVRVIEI